MPSSSNSAGVGCCSDELFLVAGGPCCLLEVFGLNRSAHELLDVAIPDSTVLVEVVDIVLVPTVITWLAFSGAFSGTF